MVPEIGVSRDQNLEAILLGRVKQIAVIQLRPAALVGGGDFMVRQGVTPWLWRSLIEKYAHLYGSKGASRGVIKHGPDLLKRNTGKPIDELRYKGTVLKILEQCGYGHSSSAKYPSPADCFSVALDRGASRPVDHGENGSTFAS